jgi:hypothetical protein
MQVSNLDPKAAFLKIAEHKQPTLLPKDKSKSAIIGPGLFSSDARFQSTSPRNWPVFQKITGSSADKSTSSNKQLSE